MPLRFYPFHATKLMVATPLMLATLLGAATAQIKRFEHIVVVVQENRTPDNLFQGLCSPPFGSGATCSTTPTATQYNISTANWLNKEAGSKVTKPLTIPLAATFDLGHNEGEWLKQCNAVDGACQMDGAALVTCIPKKGTTCPTQPQFRYTYDPDNPDQLYPYLRLASEYGFANYMFQTNQGPSFPAHQFLFGGTSAPTAADDAAGIFAIDNTEKGSGPEGCVAPEGTLEELMGPGNVIVGAIYPCFEHPTMSDLMSSVGSWRYYAPGVGTSWTAPNAIAHICQSTGPGGNCAGWGENVSLIPADVLKDIENCKLADLSWVIPTGQNSDHASQNTGGGPDWVASIVNAIGSNHTCSDGEKYWDNTAIVITWDDWGGWYDHVPSPILAGVEGSFQYGFRVPLLFVSAYTSPRFISNRQLDFGSILRFVEYNFGLTVGGLGFADARAVDDLHEFYHLEDTPRTFIATPTRISIKDFIEDKTPPTDPDDD